MIRFLLVFAIVVIFVGCSSEIKKDDKAMDGSELLGTWRLVEFIDHVNDKDNWTRYGDDYIYQKHITPTHFTWMRYKKSDDILEGIGGGTYHFENNKYIEDIHFFLPAGSSELGQSIPFDVEINEKGQWIHTGFIKRFEFDVDAGEMSLIDSVEIEEVWEKVSPESGNPIITGTWELDAYRSEEVDSLRSEYPPFVGYMKHITPSHFVWVKYNKEGDEVMAAASGTYTYQSDVYSETIETAYPKGTGLIGTAPEFDADFDQNKWHHTGQVYKLDSTGNQPKTSLVDEIWSKID